MIFQNIYKKAGDNLIPMLLSIAMMLVVSSCGGNSDDEDKIADQSADDLYMQGRDAFSEEKYKAAVEFFDEVERQHPYSEWALKAQIMTAYTHYTNEDYDDALLVLERFVKMHPGNDSVPYAYYLTALSYYEQISDVGRDQGITQKALDSLNNVINRFPESNYARDAKIKVDLTIDHLAGKEMMVGRYYQTRNEYLSAINRFKVVIDKYQTTSHAVEALHRMVESYVQLGVIAEAQRYGSVLGHNFPDSKWYRYSYKLLKDEAGVKLSAKPE